MRLSVLEKNLLSLAYIRFINAVHTVHGVADVPGMLSRFDKIVIPEVFYLVFVIKPVGRELETVYLRSIFLLREVAVGKLNLF